MTQGRHGLTIEEKMILLFQDRLGYSRGIHIGDIVEAFYGKDSTDNRQRVRQIIAKVKWYWLAQGYVLGAIKGHLGWRHCLVEAPEEAARVQKTHMQMAAGNIKRALKNEPVIGDLLPEPLQKRLQQYQPFIDLTKVLPAGGNGNENSN